MSGFEHYRQELADLDHEIGKYAMILGIDLSNAARLETLAVEGNQSSDPALASLRGLLVLRLKVETEMLDLGMSPPPLAVPAANK